MRRIVLSIGLAVAMVLAVPEVDAREVLHEGWKLESDSDGVQVYSRAVEGSQLRQVKAVTSVSASAESVIAIITDYANYRLWMNNVTDSQVIEEASESVSYVYTYEDTPWPVQNRFCVSKMTVGGDEEQTMIQFESVPRYMKSPRDAIEFISYKGYWQISRSKTGCEIEYMLEANPGGHVPAWLANQLAFGGPAKTIGNLKHLAEREDRP